MGCFPSGPFGLDGRLHWLRWLSCLVEFGGAFECCLLCLNLWTSSSQSVVRGVSIFLSSCVSYVLSRELSHHSI